MQMSTADIFIFAYIPEEQWGFLFVFYLLLEFFEEWVSLLL